jgi:hypothetical protein
MLKQCGVVGGGLCQICKKRIFQAKAKKKKKKKKTPIPTRNAGKVAPTEDGTTLTDISGDVGDGVWGRRECMKKKAYEEMNK